MKGRKFTGIHYEKQFFTIRGMTKDGFKVNQVRCDD